MLFGPRQVGKTTYLKLLIKELIEKGISCDKICYFSCDALLSNKREELREAIDFLLGKSPSYLLIDEISNIADCSFEIKFFIDSGKKRYFVCSSIFIKEYLPGRKISYHYLMPITFREFLENLSVNINEKTIRAFNLKQHQVEEIKNFTAILSTITYEFDSLNELEGKTKRIEIFYSLIEKLFYIYILIGGFPSAINAYIRYKLDNNKVHLLEEIKTNKERLIDSLRKRGKNEGICLQLINSIKKRLSSRYSFTELKETEIDLSKETIINYVSYLKSIFILKVIYAYDLGRNEVGWKKNKKIYLTDPFIYHEGKILEEENIYADEDYLSRIIESVTAISLAYLKEDIFNSLESFLFFWYNSKEIDFVLRSEGIFGIEIKFRKKIEKIHQISQVKNYIILTKNLIEHREGNEIYIPVFLFLPLLKNKEGYL